MDYATITQHLSVHGMIPRGGFYPTEADLVPVLPSGAAPKTVVLVGNTGSGMWEKFRSSELSHVARDPMNVWTEHVLTKVAVAVAADVVFPFGGPPHHPFQRWAKRSETVYSSPIGILLHPTHGLWHAYRGALLFEETIELPPVSERPSPCDSCVDKPCLVTCPVAAFSADGYDVPGCAKFLATTEGSQCLQIGCAARRACPVGRDSCYEPTHAEFHMQAFAQAIWAQKEGGD